MSRRDELIYYVKFEQIKEPQKFIWNDMVHMLSELQMMMGRYGPIEWMQQGY